MSFTAFVIGDPHFKYSNVRETVAMSQKIIEIATERAPDLIVCLGDVLDRHETVHVAPLENATRFLNGLRKIAPLYVLIGNHDRPNNSNYLTTEHPFNALKEWPNTTIVDQVVVSTIKGHRFGFVPYVPPGRFLDALETYGIMEEWLPTVTCIFAHQEFRGSKMGAIRSEVGDEWPAQFPYVITGHIHDHDQLQVNILLTGTPIQHAFGDRADKTISLVTWNSFPETETEHNLSIDSPEESQDPPSESSEDPRIGPIRAKCRYPCVPTEERIDLGLPKKILVHLHASDVPKYSVPDAAAQVKIVVTGTPAENKALAKTTIVKSLLGNGVKIVYKDLQFPIGNNTDTSDASNSRLPIRSFRDRITEAITEYPELRPVVESIYAKLPAS